MQVLKKKEHQRKKGVGAAKQRLDFFDLFFVLMLKFPSNVGMCRLEEVSFI